MSVADGEWPVVGATGARFGSARSRQRRNRTGAELAQRGRPADVPDPGEVSGPVEVGDGIPAARSAVSGGNRGSEIDVGNEDMDQPETSSFVRPFVRIGGRTRAEVELPLEALVAAVPSAQGSERGFALQEHRTVLDLCAQPRSIMEVAALAGIPLGVARVLVGDLAATGELTVHRTVDQVGPNVDLLKRVLVGLHGI